MSDQTKDVNKKIDEAEAAVKKYASKDTLISIGGYEFTPAKLMVAFTLISSTLGGLYGAFEVYKDYQNMKKKIAEYVAPDFSEFDKRLSVIEENSQKTSDYTRDIKNDLKNDLRRLEGVVESVERGSKQTAREVSAELKGMQKDVQQMQRDMDRDLRAVKKEVDAKIQKAMDNPLANNK